MTRFNRQKTIFLGLLFFINGCIIIGLTRKNRSAIDALTFTLLSATNFEEIRNMTFGSVRKMVVQEKIELIQFDMLAKVVQGRWANDIECLYLANAAPPYYACHKIVDDLSKRVRRHLYWERGTQHLIKKFFDSNPDSTFLDLGSNVGYHSLFAASLNKNIKVLSVEPFPQNVLLMHQAAYLNNVQHQIEVSNHIF